MYLQCYNYFSEGTYVSSDSWKLPACTILRLLVCLPFRMDAVRAKHHLQLYPKRIILIRHAEVIHMCWSMSLCY